MSIALLIFFGLLITYSFRGIALLYFARIRLPDHLYRALPFIPICVLSAMSFGSILPSQQERLAQSLLSPDPLLLATLAAALVSWWRRDLFSPIIAGALIYYASLWLLS